MLQQIDENRLGDHAAELGAALASAVEELSHALISQVRGAGLLIGVVLTSPVSKIIESAARAAGFLVNAPAPDVIRLAPPLILTQSQVTDFSGALPTILDFATPK
ncbi:hypothetical protein StoSoilB22_19140 [Arthrobacter sp. StoSoilB22]|nr:hypothetical protein StoSoilB22_19140 [Arthrobacter sp. StoSoilB22]